MNVQIGYGQIDPSAKPDSAPSSAGCQPWNSLDALKTDNLSVLNVATLETNQAVLDGAQTHLPNQPENYQWGFWSAQTSDDEGNFRLPPALDIRFSQAHKAPGLNFRFYPHSADWATRVRVTWFDGEDGVVKAGEYEISGEVGEVLEPVANFRRVLVEFLQTNLPRRYVKLVSVNYGKGRAFPNNAIFDASILEEVDPTGNEVSVNTLRFCVRTHEPGFSLVCDDGGGMLMKNQPMRVTADGNDFGTFFLQLPWQDRYGDGTDLEFSAVDAVGAMEQYRFFGGVYTDVPAKSILDELFDVCFPTRGVTCALDDAYTGKTLSGWLPACTCRQALQQVCFALGAVADASRGDCVNIYPPDAETGYTIPPDKLYKSAKISPTAYYSGVEVVAHEYVASSETAQAYSGEMEAGRHTVLFAEPLHSLIVTGGTLVEATANHAVVHVAAAGAVVITGGRYVVNSPVFAAREEVLAGEVENVKLYDGCTLLSPRDGQARADGLFRLLRRRAQFEGGARLEKAVPGAAAQQGEEGGAFLRVGEAVEVPTVGRPICGTVEKLEINLRGGRAKVRVTGNVAASGG